MKKSKAVITVIGKDTVGILAKVTALCSESEANIIEVTQSVLDDMFAMIMLADISAINEDFTSLSGKLRVLGDNMNLKIHVIHEDVFNSMHRI